MEIDVTRFYRLAEASDFQASATELGANAGRITWQNAMREAEESPILATEEEVSALRDYCEGFGAWSRDEIDAWSAQECNAMMAQLVAAEMREHDLDGGSSESDWQAYEESGQGGSLYRGDDGCVYFYLGE